MPRTRSDPYERLLPAPEVERDVLAAAVEAAAMLDTGYNETALRAMEAVEALTVDVFRAGAPRAVFAAEMTVLHTAKTVSWALILEELRRSNAGVDAIHYLTDLATAKPVLTAVPRSVRVLQRAARRRQVFGQLQAVQAELVQADELEEAESLLARLPTLIESSPWADHRDPDIHEFMARQTDDTMDWVLAGVLARRERVTLTGTEGAGKSTLVRQLAVQAAAGLQPFTLEAQDPIRVLLVDLENSEEHVRRQFRPLLISADQAGAPVGPGMLIPIVQPEGLDLLDATDAGWLKERVAANEPQLLCIGPRYKMAGGDPKEEEVARRLVGVLDEIRARSGAAILIEDHQPHAQSGDRVLRPIGSSVWLRWPEFGFSIHADGRLGRWRGEREQRPWPLRLQRGGAWPWTPAVVSAGGMSVDDEILQILQGHLSGGGDPSWKACRKVVRANGVKVSNDAFGELRLLALSGSEGTML